MKRCPNCQHEVRDEDRVCPYCGHILNNEPRVIRISLPIWPIIMLVISMTFLYFYQPQNDMTIATPKKGSTIGEVKDTREYDKVMSFSSYATFSNYFANGEALMSDALSFEKSLETFLKDQVYRYQKNELVSLYSNHLVETITQYEISSDHGKVMIEYCEDNQQKESLWMTMEVEGMTLKDLEFIQDESHPFHVLFKYFSGIEFSKSIYASSLIRFQDLNEDFEKYQGHIGHYGIGIQEEKFKMMIYPTYDSENYQSQFSFMIK